MTTEATNHLETYIYRVPKKNHDAVVANLKKFVPWFERNGVGLEYYQFLPIVKPWKVCRALRTRFQ